MHSAAHLRELYDAQRGANKANADDDTTGPDRPNRQAVDTDFPRREYVPGPYYGPTTPDAAERNASELIAQNEAYNQGYYTPRDRLYTSNDAWVPHAENWSRERIIRLQSALAGLGLLTTFKRGYWDHRSHTAFTKLLSYSNSTNQGYQKAIGELASLPAGTVSDHINATIGADSATQPKFIESTYLAPDTDVVRANVKQMIINSVGRGYVTDERIERMTQLFMSDYRAQFEQQERIRQHEFNAQIEAAGTTGPQMSEPVTTESVSADAITGAVLGGAGEALPEEETEEESGSLEGLPEETVIDAQANLEAAVMEELEPIAEGVEEEERSDLAEESIFNVFGAMGAIGGGQ